MTTRKAYWPAICITIAVVIMVTIGFILMAIFNKQAERDDQWGTDQWGTDATGTIFVGDGPDEVEVWFDFYCPKCQDFEETYGPTIRELTDNGSITLLLHPVALSGLNKTSGTDFSERSGGALLCVAETAPDSAYSFFAELFALRPTGAGLSDDELADLAASVGAPDAKGCITDGTYRQLAVEQTQQIPVNPETGKGGTPTLVVNGEYVPVTGDVEADVANRLG